MITTQADWIAVDWGTTRLRVWCFAADGTLVAALSSNDGFSQLTPAQFEPALRALIDPYLSAQRTLILCCGMVGARQGWQEAPYITAPCSPLQTVSVLRARTRDPRLDLRIIAGIKQNNPDDVMRGEETQIAGWLHTNPDFNGVICLPGTHAKWVTIRAGTIDHFTTCMTGELFAWLTTASILKHQGSAKDWDHAAFLAAINLAIAQPETISAALFKLRAESLLRDLPPTQLRARISGLLIGIELAATRDYWQNHPVLLIAPDSLKIPYYQALSHIGITPLCSDSEQMTLTGLRAAYQAIIHDNPHRQP